MFEIFKSPSKGELAIMSFLVVGVVTFFVHKGLMYTPFGIYATILFLISWSFYSMHEVEAETTARLLLFGSSTKRIIGDGVCFLPVFFPFLHHWWIVWPYDLKRERGTEFKNTYTPHGPRSKIFDGTILKASINRSEATQEKTVVTDAVTSKWSDLRDASNRKMVFHNIGTIFFVIFLIVAGVSKTLAFSESFSTYVVREIRTGKCVMSPKDKTLELNIISFGGRDNLRDDLTVEFVNDKWWAPNKKYKWGEIRESLVTEPNKIYKTPMKFILTPSDDDEKICFNS